MVTNPAVFLLTGAEAEGSAILEAVPVEGQAPETQGAVGGAPEPMEVAGGEAPVMAGGESDDVPPESTLEVVVHSPEIQDAEPIHSAPMAGATTSSRGGIELLADELVDPAPSPSTTTKSRICRRRATSLCGRTSRSATRIKVRVVLKSTC
jgi:hypothetical protein